MVLGEHSSLIQAPDDRSDVSTIKRTPSGILKYGAGSPWESTSALDDSASVFNRIRNRMMQIRRADTRPMKEHFNQQAKYESLDYEFTESEVELEERRKYSNVQEKWKSITRWFVMFLIGFFTALIAFTIDISIKSLAKVKFDYVGESMRHCITEGCLAYSFLLWTGINCAFVGIATFLVSVGSPIAAGSGIPEIKCYLNGIKIPGVVRLKTLVSKCVGVMFSVAGGLFVGKEGPMIHSGAVVAAGISQGKSTTFRWLNSGLFRRFRNDQEKRDFVAAGAAAGVSAAFGAPIGGVLFSLEEGASFWNQALTWRIFFASMTATFTLNILLSDANPNDQSNELSNPGLLNFGQFENMPYSTFEIPVFIVIGTVGGLLGALFNALNFKLTKFRMKFVTSTKQRATEAVVVCILTVSVSFLLMFLSSDCLPLGDDPDDTAVQMFCEDHQYSAMASLLFNTAEDSIKNLFHSKRDNFQVETLGLFALAYFCCACITYGVAVPSGLFVPCILTGAAWGRMIGTLLAQNYPETAWTEPGKYALIGAAAMLGGVVRMTISLTVIIIEATGNITYGLPIMVVVVFAKWVGDCFNEGLYDIHIEIKHIPLLAWEPPMKAKHFLTADDLMSRSVVCMKQVVNVGQLYYMLKAVDHQAFPILEFDSSKKRNPNEQQLGTIHGIVLRHQLTKILKYRGYGDRIQDTVRCKRLDFDDFKLDYPRHPTIDDIDIPIADFDKYIDLGPYLNPSPYVVAQESTLSRIFRLFRTMGLRHLVVVNKSNEVVGMVTRKDLSNVRDHHTKRYLRRQNIGSQTIRYILPDEFNGITDADHFASTN